MSARILIADCHFGKKSAVPGDILKVCLSLIEDCKSRGIHKISVLGDLMESRSIISYKCLRDEVTYWLDECKKADIEIELLAGNHCFPFMDKRTPSNLRELDLRGARIIDEITKEGQILWIPWLYPGEVLDFKGIKVGLGHLAINGMKMSKTYIADCGIDAPTTTVQLYLGDFHLPQEEGNIRYLGAPVHLTWNDSNTDRHAVILDDNLDISEEIRLNDRFCNRIEIDLHNIDSSISVTPGSQVKIRNADIADMQHIEQAMIEAGASAVEIIPIDNDLDEGVEDVPESLSVEEAIVELIFSYDDATRDELIGIHQELLLRVAG